VVKAGGTARFTLCKLAFFTDLDFHKAQQFVADVLAEDVEEVI
jgi:hypothetical protein